MKSNWGVKKVISWRTYLWNDTPSPSSRLTCSRRLLLHLGLESEWTIVGCHTWFVPARGSSCIFIRALWRRSNGSVVVRLILEDYQRHSLLFRHITHPLSQKVSRNMNFMTIFVFFVQRNKALRIIIMQKSCTTRKVTRHLIHNTWEVPTRHENYYESIHVISFSIIYNHGFCGWKWSSGCKTIKCSRS